MSLVIVSVVGAAAFQWPSNWRTAKLMREASRGFLIIGSKLGYNDSVDHGVSAKPWPVITVTQGQQVNITVCNTDIQAHGFQVAHYFDSTIESIAPGQVVRVSFTADQEGVFQIYCSIFYSVYALIQNGQLRVAFLSCLAKAKQRTL